MQKMNRDIKKFIQNHILNWDADAEFEPQPYSKSYSYLHTVLLHLSWPEFGYTLEFPL